MRSGQSEKGTHTKHEKMITLTTTQHTTPQDNTTQQHDYNTTIWNCVKPVRGSESYLLSSPHDVAQVQHIPIVCMPPQARFNFFMPPQSRVEDASREF